MALAIAFAHMVTKSVCQWQRCHWKSRLLLVSMILAVAFAAAFPINDTNYVTAYKGASSVSKGTNEKLNSPPRLRANSSGNSNAEQGENTGSSPGTGGAKPPEDRNGGSTESGENESPSTGGENTDSSGSEESELPSSSTLEAFEEAIKRACSPSVRSSLFDKVGSSVSGAVEQMDQWMNNLLGAMTTLESDPTALYEYLKGTGSLTDVLKSSFLFGLSIIAGAIVAVVYLLCCLPTICYKYLRRLCCCSKCCSGKSGLCSRMVWAIVIAALTLMGIVFACLVLHYQSQGVHGARQLQCQTYEFANETLRGTEALQGNDTQADTPLPDEFEGLLPLVDNAEALVLLFDASNPDNVVELSKQAATKALDVVPISENMNTAIGNLSSACVAFSANNSLSGSFHKSLWCDAVNDPSASLDIAAIEEQMSSSAKVIVAVDPKKQLDKIFEKVELPVLNVKDIFPIGTVKELFLTAFDALASTEGIVSKALQWLDIGLKVDCSFDLAILLLIALWTIWFFCRGAGAGSGTPALLWNILAWVVVIFLIFGGALGWVMTIGRQGCSIITNTCLEEDNWELLSDYAPVVEPLISECLSKEGEGDMLAAVGAKEAFNQVLDTLKKTLGSFPTDMAPLDEKTSALAESYVDAAKSFGALVTVDQDSVANARKNVFPEFLKSGMQIQDVDLGGETLYGLATLESLVSPWKLHALHPEEPEDGDFIVTDVIPIEADSDYVKWLEDLRESKKAEFVAAGSNEQEAEEKAENFRVWTKNGIWWLQQKQKVLGTKYKCVQEGQESSCSYAEMFGLDSSQMQASYMNTQQLAAGQNYLRVSSCLVNAVLDAVAVLNDKTVYVLEDLQESLNCRFLRRNVVQVAVLACESTVSSFYYVAMYRALGGGVACLVLLALFILWFKLKFGKETKKSSSGEKASV